MKIFVVLFEYDKFDSVWSTREKAEERMQEIWKMDEEIQCEIFEARVDDSIFVD